MSKKPKHKPSPMDNSVRIVQNEITRIKVALESPHDRDPVLECCLKAVKRNLVLAVSDMRLFNAQSKGFLIDVEA